jgi:hypothetical protein
MTSTYMQFRALHFTFSTYGQGHCYSNCCTKVDIPVDLFNADKLFPTRFQDCAVDCNSSSFGNLDMSTMSLISNCSALGVVC